MGHFVNHQFLSMTFRGYFLGNVRDNFLPTGHPVWQYFNRTPLFSEMPQWGNVLMENLFMGIEVVPFWPSLIVHQGKLELM